MNRKYKRYLKEDFNNWREKIRKRLPELTIKFYTAKQNGAKIDQDKERLLGQVIYDINDRSYLFWDVCHKRIPDNELIIYIVALEGLVEDLFEYVNTKL